MGLRGGFSLANALDLLVLIAETDPTR